MSSTMNNNLEKHYQEKYEELEAKYNELKKRSDEISGQLEEARALQKGILPDELLNWHYCKFASRYIAMEEVGGDFYDTFQVKGGKLGFLIADVSGHGIPAAFLTIMAKASFNFYSKYYDSPAEIFRHVNNDLYSFVKTNAYLTCFMFVIDTKLNITYCNAGHQRALLLRKGAEQLERLDTNGIFLGAFDDAGEMYENKKLKLKPGDRLILYTDGIVEAINEEREEYGHQRFEEIIKFSSELGNDLLADIIIDDIESFCLGFPKKDDIAMVIMDVSENFSSHLNVLKQIEKLEAESSKEKLLPVLEKVIGINPDDLISKRKLINLYLEYKNDEKALPLIEDYLTRDKTNIELYSVLAKKYAKREQYFRAFLVSRKGLNYEPFNKQLLNQAGKYCIEMKDYQEAAEYFEKAINYYPDFEEAKENLKKAKQIISQDKN